MSRVYSRQINPTTVGTTQVQLVLSRVLCNPINRKSTLDIPGDVFGVDMTLPTATVGTPDRTKVSNQLSSTYTITSNEDYQAYQLRIVPSVNSLVTDGTLLESGGSGTGGVPRSVNVTAAEIQAASGVEGANIVKAFFQDLAGNWSNNA